MEMMSSIIDAFDVALSLTDYTYEELETLQLQEALQASLSHHHSLSITNPPSSSSSRIISCGICTEDKQESDMFDLDGCSHAFCAACVAKHVEYKLRDNVIHVTCPDHGCRSAIEPRALRLHIAAEVLDRWEEAVAESAILASERVRCPYAGCGEVLVNDGGGGGGAAAAVAECECPWCHRLFCARCKVPWHEGLECGEFGREKEELRRLAREKKWKECPHCKVFVDKTGGCIHITCRCKFEFCYACGQNWNESHFNTCQEQ